MNKNRKHKYSLLQKIVRFCCFGYIICFLLFLFVFYGPFEGFRDFWITTAMTTMSHRYLATFFYSDQYINKVLERNSIIESRENTNPNFIKMRKYTSTIYRNEYEKDILERDGINHLYKVIKIEEKSYNGFLIAIYDPSRVYLAVTSKLNVSGESIMTVSKREEAIIAMNASGFYDPDWNGNGAIPHGTVISKGKVVSDFADANMSGGFIGFNEDNKLVLARVSKEKAITMGYRDAIEFGPYLIVNGKRSFIKGNGGWGVAPRSAIAQRKDGIVLFLVINGRLVTSIGADMVDLCDILERYGAYNAANLDGGASSELVINNRIINTPVAGGENGLRKMPTFWVVK